MNKLLGYEKMRFVIVGFLNTSLDFILLNVIVGILGGYLLVANTISVSIGITISYFLNHNFVFRNQEAVSWSKYIKFFAVTGFSSLIIQDGIILFIESITSTSFGRSIFFINALEHHETLRLNAAKAAAVLIGMVWNFTLYKYFVFKNNTSKAIEASIISEP